MKDRCLIVILMFMLFTCLFSQNLVLERTNIEILQQLSLDLASLYQIRHQEAILIATEKGWPIKQVREDGSVIELQFLRDGFPVYYVTGNGVSAETISTNQVRPGGTTGLNLDGTGMVLYEWDAGKVLLSHQELTGRITIGDPASNTDLHDHSTHVAGTLIAAGIDMSAVGMAYNGTLIDYDWDDDNSEMSAAGAGGALISNHSYSFITGWYYNYRNDGLWCWFGDTTVSETEDYYFGFYDSEAQAWDNIAYNAPYLLICKSAGNDRTDCGPEPGGQHWVWDPDLDNWVYSWQTRDPDGDYDCIGTRGSAKNLLTVGAVNDIQGGYEEVADVVATSFTSWGPPDDGRIKPDVVANGQHLWSPISTGNTDYAFKSGTSMSTPSVAGSAALLQEHYSELYRDYMLSSTLKGLIINTADEAGPAPGPDYMFGWGLMNTRTAADAITDKDEYSLIIEEELANSESYEISVTPNIAETLTATLCWTDIPGTPVSPQVDPSDPMLVNDLDMRITRPGFTAYPWKLNPLNPTAAASNNSDNPVDNVEKIEISNPEPEIHTITITHKGTLTSPQTFSLIVTGIDSKPAEIDVNPALLDVNLSPDETADETLRITNNGIRDLVYNCDIELLSRSLNKPEKNNEIVIGLESLDNTLKPEKYDIDSVELKAYMPAREEIEIHHDNGNLAGALGCGGAAYFTTAARFTPDELDPYYGGYALTKVKFFITSWPFTSVVLKVWRGGQYGDAGTEIYSQDVTSSVVSDSWNEFELTSPIPFIADDEYWLGYYITIDEYSFPAAYDSGPGVGGKGIWLSWFGGAWEDLFENDDPYDCNWLLRGVIEPQWLSITANGSGIVPGSARDYVDVNIHFNATDLTIGTDKTANIIIASNDPFNPEIIIPVSMHVEETQPNPPTNPVVFYAEGNIVLEWDAVPGATSYNVYSDTDPYGDFTTLEAGGVTGTTWTDTDTAGIKKFYVIRANN